MQINLISGAFKYYAVIGGSTLQAIHQYELCLTNIFVTQQCNTGIFISKCLVITTQDIGKRNTHET